METIFHITPRQDWEKAKAIGVYRAQSLETEGFIHCSTSAQVVKVANYFFKNQTDLLLLCINSDEVESEIRYDLVLGKERFPHIYGALNINAVFKAINFEANQDGLFELPSRLSI